MRLHAPPPTHAAAPEPRSTASRTTGGDLLMRVAAATARRGAAGELMRQPPGGSRSAQAPTARPVPDFLHVFRWPLFRNSGTSVCAGHALGVNPGGEFLNAMELVFTEQPAAADLRRRLARGGYSGYRVRQSLAEQNWQFVNGTWSLVAQSPEGTPDDPDPALQCWSEPEMRTLDTPGFSGWMGVNAQTRQFGFGGVRSDVNATVVWVQQNFHTWMEGERVFTGGWDTVSVRFPWHNSLRLERASPTSGWSAGPLTHIQSGHMEFGPTPASATR